MKVVAALPSYIGLSTVGAWIATHQWLVACVRAGHDVDVMTLHTMTEHGPVEPYEVDGVRVARRGRDYADVFGSADVVVSHVGDNMWAHRWAHSNRVPSVRIAHSIPANQIRERVAGAALVVANSQWTARAFPTDVPLVVCHPITWPADYATTSGDRVSIVNLSEYKGGQLFWQVAERMPDVEFLAVKGGYGDQIVPDAIPANVDLVEPTQNMRSDVYARTRLLLFPSMWESWGMVAVEAACSGIPTIAHPSPGLKEAMGSAAWWVGRHDVAGWEVAIRRLLTPSAWSVASQVARQRVDQLDPARSAIDFVDAVEQVVARRQTVGV